ncbi:restriction endonuclease subunit S [Weissella confusa]|uniref:restriction endonuclease subunit S n=1 Tax=Weissella confusa TaxID=1583 RepID=UPI0018F1A77C|nr:restriction endonuclease subunit S [Weissella confusa]MBJ7678728.1 restriction endonuclease subunit S [Weissella confusa]
MSNKVPQIRFNGYSDDWEERKLIEVADYRNGKAHEKDISEDGEYIVVNSKFVSTNGLVKKYSDEMIAPLSKNEIAFVLSDVPNGRAIARTFLINKDNKYSLNQRIAGITPHADTNSYFLNSLMNRNHYFLRFDDGVSQTNLSKKEVEKWVELYPIYQEQQKIGSFFKQIDETIALHQRKLDLLKEQKKGYLQKMFPKNGEKVPELRFAGFADDWEDRKLKDVTERVRSNDGRMDLPTLTMSASSGWLDQKDRFSGDISGKEKKNYTLLKKGELSYNHGNSKLAKYGVVFSLTNYEEALVPRVYHSFKALENTSADFIEYMFSTKLPDRELGKLVSSGARMDGLLNINYDDFMNIHISIPNYEEQILMSAFFRKLDETIALHQRKLELLKEQKKGFLQKMFV